MRAAKRARGEACRLKATGPGENSDVMDCARKKVEASNVTPAAVRVARRDIVVVGASAGGLRALAFLLGRLSQTSLASFFVVVHVVPHHASNLADLLQQASYLPVLSPRDGDTIRPGRIYVCVPDRHLIIEPGRVRLSAGQRECGYRPSIDVLFRSAAHLYGSRVTGVLLSGALSDGVAGLAAIKRYGGLTVVQNPNEAPFSDMPRAAIAEGVADHSVPLSEILSILRDHCGGFVRLPEVPRAEPYEIGGSPRGESVAPHDRALWKAARLLQQHADLLRRLAATARERGHAEAAGHYEARARDRDQDAAALCGRLAQQPETAGRGHE